MYRRRKLAGRLCCPAFGLVCVLAGAGASAQPLDVTCDEPGWNWVDVGITLTGNQPTYWSAATGSGGENGVAVSPFTVLDPGPPPGRPATDGSRDRVLRGYIIAWAVNATGGEIRWNHLKGDAVIVNYDRGSAWEYNAYAFQAVASVANGANLLDPGELRLDGDEYDRGFDLLVVDFFAGASDPFDFALLDTSLTLMPLTIDLRQETDGPVTTKASFTIWNQNETKLTGLDRCVTCWDDTLFTQYGIPNHFLVENLQTTRGKAQIDGIPSQLCNRDYDPGDGLALGADPRDVVSSAASLLGVQVLQPDRRILRGEGEGYYYLHDSAGEHLSGMGVESGSILVDIIGQDPPERPAAQPSGVRPTKPLAGNAAGNTSGSAYAAPVVLSPSDRLSASEKGSLLIFPKVELRWDGYGQYLLQDTFIDITNDYPGEVQVQMYFVQGDPPFISDGIDANTNGVADDCESRLRWGCGALDRGVDGGLGGCQPDPYGPFESLIECTANCRFSCGFNRGVGGCYPDPYGAFETLADCETACQPHSCVTGVRGPGLGFCIPDPEGPYASLAECESDCGTRYECTETANGTECLPNAQGSFATLGDCLTACQRYSCTSVGSARGFVAGTCVPDAAGPYATLSSCLANCAECEIDEDCSSNGVCIDGQCVQP